jgi:hypothetical protein
MKHAKSLRALTVATPLAFAAVLASAPLASAGIGDAALGSPHVTHNGDTLGVLFSSTITDQGTDDAVAQKVTEAFLGDWANGLIESAVHNAPPSVSTCRVTVTATDPSGATGTTSAVIPTGVTTSELDIPDQAHGTKWGVGDLDDFSVQVTCTDNQRGGQVSKVIVDQNEIAG